MSRRGQVGIVLAAFLAGGLTLLGQKILSGELDLAALLPRNEAPLKIGAPAPALTLPDLDGKLHALADWRGQRVLVNFWATWCAPCRAEMPMLAAAQQHYAAQGVQIVGVALDDPAQVRAWRDAFTPGYPLLLDDPSTHPTTSAWGNPRALLPYSVLVSADGTVLRRKFGAFDGDELQRWLMR